MLADIFVQPMHYVLGNGLFVNGCTCINLMLGSNVVPCNRTSICVLLCVLLPCRTIVRLCKTMHDKVTFTHMKFDGGEYFVFHQTHLIECGVMHFLKTCT